MDKFLKEQKTGEVVDRQNPFTIDRARSRDKLLKSIPPANSDAVYRLLDACLIRLGHDPTKYVTWVPGSRNEEPSLMFRLPGVDRDFKASVLDELQRPFGEDSAASLLARALYRGTRGGALVRVYFRGFGGLFDLLNVPSIILKQDSYDVPDEVSFPESEGMGVLFSPSHNTGDLSAYRKSTTRHFYLTLQRRERLVPLESLNSEVQGYFDYRTKAFTAIRSYSTLPDDSEEPGFLFDLFDGPYAEIDEKTRIIEEVQGKKFFIFHWRPNYKRPTMLHQFLDSEFRHGDQKLKASFWVSTHTRPASVQFLSNGVMSDHVGLKGPVGLSGVVSWPGLKFDIWGTQLVKDKAYEEALSWAQSRVDSTAQCLSDNLEDVLKRVQASSLLKKSYQAETLEKMRFYWQRK